MSDIKVGDLVVVVRWPCCGIRLGAMMKVEKIEPCIDTNFCTACWAPHPSVRFVAIDGILRAPVEWLKRIPPLSELERVTEKEELHA